MKRRRDARPEHYKKQSEEHLARHGFKSRWEYQMSLPSAKRTRQLANERNVPYQAARERQKVDEYKALTSSEKEQVREIYAEMKRLNKEAGRVAYHVDHIKPISKGGAHHPDNLQILTAEENLKKSDHFHSAN